MAHSQLNDESLTEEQMLLKQAVCIHVAAQALCHALRESGVEFWVADEAPHASSIANPILIACTSLCEQTNLICRDKLQQM